MSDNEELSKQLSQKTSEQEDYPSLHRNISRSTVLTGGSSEASKTILSKGKPSICHNFKFKNPGEIHSRTGSSETSSQTSQTVDIPLSLSQQATSFLHYSLNSEWEKAYEYLPVLAKIAEMPFMLDRIKDEKAHITPLMMAAKDGQVKIVENLLNWGVNPDATDVDGNAAVHYSVSTGSTNCLKVLLEYLARRDVSGGQKKASPIHIAATIKDEHLSEEILNLLVKEKSDLFLLDADGWIPLFYAVNCMNHSIVRYLLKNESNKQLTFKDAISGSTAFHIACNNGVSTEDSLNMLSMLIKSIEKGNDIPSLLNQRNKKGRTPLHLSAYGGLGKIVKFLRKSGAAASILDNKDKTALQLAIEGGHFELFDLLVSTNNQEIRNRDRNGDTLIHLAARYNLNVKAVQSFLNGGVNYLMPNKNGETCLHAAVASGNVEILEMMFSLKCDVNMRNKNNFTALHIAVMNLRENIVELLLGAGADVDAIGGEFDETPLLIASANPSGYACAHSLIRSGADVASVNKNDDTALHLAASVGNVELLVQLINENSVLNMKNNQGNTPLHLAVLYCHKRAVISLLEHIKKLKGLSEATEHVNVKNNNGETPLHFAAGLSKEIQHYENESIEIIAALMEFKADYSIENAKKETPFHYCARGGDRQILKEFFHFLKTKGNFHQILRNCVNCKALNGWTPMHCASYFNHPTLVQLLIKIDCRIDFFDNEGYTPVHLAAREGHATIVDILMKKTAFLDSRTTQGYTPLHLAAKYGHEGCVLLLIKRYKAKVDVYSLNGSTPLHLAAESGKHKICKALLKNKIPANPNVFDKKKRTPLHLAAANNHRSVFKCFNIHAKGTISDILYDVNGRTYAHYAAMNGSTEFFKEIMKVNQRMAICQRDKRFKNTALHFAAEGGHLEIVQLILAGNDYVVDENLEGNTPIHLAAFKGHGQIINCLRSVSNLNKCSFVHGLSPLHSAALAGQLEALQQIVEAGVDYNMRSKNSLMKMVDDDYGYTALHFASFYGHEEVVRYLLQLDDIEMDAKTVQMGSLSVHLAAANGHLNIISLCLSMNSSLIEAQDNDGLTVLHFAAAFGHIHLVSLLISQGSEINKKENQGHSPLHYAAQAGHIAAVKLLVDSGANLVITSNSGDMPICLAAQENHTEVVRYLLGQYKHRDILLHDYKFLYHLMECGKLDNNHSITDFIIQSDAPPEVAAKLSKRFKNMEKNKKVRSADFKNAKLHCQYICVQLLVLATKKTNITNLLYSVNDNEETFMDVMLQNKQKLVLSDPIVQQFITDMWYQGAHNLRHPNKPLKLWQKYDIPCLKFTLYFLSHIVLIILLFCAQYPNVYMQKNLLIDDHNYVLHIWLFGYVFAEYVNRLVMSYVRIINLGIAMSGVLLHYSALLISAQFYSIYHLQYVLYIRNQLFAIANFLFILTTLEFLKFHYFFGPWTLILKSLFMEMVRFSVILLLFIFGFWCIFISLHKPISTPDSEYYREISPTNLLKILYFSLFGLVDYNALPQPKYVPSWAPCLSHIMICIYLMFTCVVLVNLLITRLCDIYKEISDCADIEWKFGRVAMIWKLSRISLMPGPVILITQLCVNIKEIYQRIKYPGKTEIVAKMIDVVDWGKIVSEIKLSMENS